MIGVTFFGIFLTPVFYYVIRGLSKPANAPIGERYLCVAQVLCSDGWMDPVVAGAGGGADPLCLRITSVIRSLIQY